MTRRTFLASAAAVGLKASPPKSAMGVVIHSFGMRRPNDAMEFLELCHSLGAGGIQTRLQVKPPATLAQLRERAEQYEMFIEATSGLPRTDDTSEFEKIVTDAKQAGALCIRTACLSGRRYETFDTLAAWKEFVANSKAGIARAVPIVEKHRIPLGIENHKDWIIEEHLALLKEYESEFLGVTLDTGNNISLLDDPMEHTEALAPYAVASHLKDMGVEEYEDGFLLSEVPMGDGMLDMKRIADIIHKARPKTNMSVEMITRDPLKIPCLTDKYWVTFPGRDPIHLARTLRMVRANKPANPLPRMEALDRDARLRLEIDNVKQCLHYAREQMNL